MDEQEKSILEEQLNQGEKALEAQYLQERDAPQYRICSFLLRIENGRAKYATILFIITAHEKNKISIEKKFIDEIGDFDEGSGRAPTPEEAVKIIATSKEFVSIVEKMEEVSTLLFDLYGEKEAEDLYPGLNLDYHQVAPNPRRFYNHIVQQFEEELNEQIKELQRQAKEKTKQQEKANQAPRITAKAIQDGIKYPLDKTNSLVWALLESSDPNGQLSLKIDTSKKGSKQDSIVLYAIDFSDLQDITITKQLTPLDKRVYIACGALWDAGNTITTIEQIHYTMGNKTPPSPTQRDNINQSLTKMVIAHLYISNKQECEQTRGNSLFVYDASLLPFERVGAYINGKYTESAIHFFREPPLISFAKMRNQITAIPQQLLTSPINKTVLNLQLEDYLILRISHMKNNPKLSRKIKYTTVYDACGIKDKKQRQRTTEKITRYLQHYKSEAANWIKDFHETKEKDGVLIFLE